MLFEFFVQLLEGLINAELAGIVGENVQEPRELARAAWPEFKRRVSEWTKVDPPQIHHLRVERAFFVEPTPFARTHPTDALPPLFQAASRSPVSDVRGLLTHRLPLDDPGTLPDQVGRACSRSSRPYCRIGYAAQSQQTQDTQ
jgi:hypothetical protein